MEIDKQRLREERSRLVTETVARVREIAGKDGRPDRDALGRIRDELIALAGHRHLWNAPEFAEPDDGALQARYLIHEDDDHGYALYLNVMLPGKKIVPHNHTTWACIAAVEGTELNTLYRRTDDGSRSGESTLEPTEVIRVEPGTGIAMAADDIHSVHIPGSGAIRHLHMYGRALETLSERLAFDLETGRHQRMALGVQSRRA